MLHRILICFVVAIGRTISFFSKTFNLGHGSTWPGHIALHLAPNILSYFSKQVKNKIILIAGTNGKTTTSLMIRSVLIKKDKRVIHNESGANLLNGLVSAFILKSNLLGKIETDYAIFEVDEASLPIVIKNVQLTMYNNQKLVVVLLNLFRDQLDRYGEVDTIARKWNEAVETLSSDTILILNADDPQIAEMGVRKKDKVFYFGLEDRKLFLHKKEHATDSIFCLGCGGKLEFDGVFFSHLGHWHCPTCLKKRHATDLSRWPEILPGVYNRYNTLASVLTLLQIGYSHEDIKKYLIDFKPAFGRQEEFVIEGKKIMIFLSKNPAGFNESLRTTITLGAKEILLVLNDRIPDGRDVSWIWDVDFEMLPKNVVIFVSGDRLYDMALRIKYAKENKLIAEKQLEKAVKIALENIKIKETLYILATYSAMLDVRKILSGKKIL